MHRSVREHPDFLILLRKLLAWLGRGSSWQRHHWEQDRFAAAAGGFDEPVLSWLSEVLWSGKADARTVASVLEEAPNDLVFNHVNFVSETLNAAARFGSDELRRMRGGVARAAEQEVERDHADGRAW
jgi:hypothetical protein